MSDDNDTVIMTRVEWAAIKKHMEDLERSAASAREIARAAMSQTGTRAIRAEMVVHSDGTIQVIVCDPAGNEIETARRVAQLMDAGILSSIGAKPKDDNPVPVGSTA